MEAPAHLAWLAADPDGRAWLDTVPARLERARTRWGLDLGTPFGSGGASLTSPARTGDGDEVVLKLQFPHRECAREAAALGAWNGRGAVRLVAHDEADHALLLERCMPGTALSAESADVALGVLVDLLPRLCVATDEPFDRLDDEAVRWRATLDQELETGRRGMDRDLVTIGLGCLEELLASPSVDPHVLLHQDLHGDNVLSDGDRWLAIDPKPLVGDAAFAVAPIVRSPELGHDRQLVERRFDELTRTLDVDRRRARSWTIAQSLALAQWADDPEFRAPFVEVARWLAAGLDRTT